MMIHDGNGYFDYIQKPNFEHNSYISYNFDTKIKRYDLS